MQHAPAEEMHASEQNKSYLVSLQLNQMQTHRATKFQVTLEYFHFGLSFLLLQTGAGWSQTGHIILGRYPSWNAWCMGFCWLSSCTVHRSRWDGHCQGYLIRPQTLPHVTDWVWLGCRMRAMLQALFSSRKCQTRSVTLTDEMPILKFCCLPQNVGNVILKSHPSGIICTIEVKKEKRCSTRGHCSHQRNLFCHVKDSF